jgi:hypothetical protein
LLYLFKYYVPYIRYNYNKRSGFIMAPVKHGRFRKTAMAIGVSAAIAFGAFFSAGKALAKKYKCYTREVGSAAKKEAQWKGRKKRTLWAYVQNGEKTRQVRMPYSLFLAHKERSDAELGQLIGANLDHATAPGVQKRKRGSWEEFNCIILAPKAPRTRLITDDVEAAEKPVPIPKPPKRTIHVVGNWVSPLKFKKNPPLSNGRRFSPGTFPEMLIDNKEKIMAIFNRVLKRNPNVGGKLYVKIEIGSNGVPKKVSFQGTNLDVDLIQKYADLFGCSKWKGAGTIKFPLILNASN